MTWIILSILGFVLITALYSSFTIVKPYQKRTLTVFGDFWRVLDPGINFVPPFVSSLFTYDMREQTIDVPKQDVITQDNAPVTADGVIYIKIQDVKKTFLEIEDHRRAVQNLSQTSLRAVIGNMELDETLNRRDIINTRIQEELAEPTDEWGISVKRVEIKNIHPSDDVRQAMEEQTSAERRRRAMVTEARGKKRSEILKAEGEKRSRIIRAEGEKQERIRVAQGEAQSLYLRAVASQTMGEQAVIVRSLEALEAAAEERSNSFFFPFEFSGTVGRVARNLSDTDYPIEKALEGTPLSDLPDEVKDLLDPEKISEAMSEIDLEEETGEATISEEDLQTEGPEEQPGDISTGGSDAPEAPDTENGERG
jgi:regulator of protease activity HflC (stomatin/prohibitin superfamily)